MQMKSDFLKFNIIHELIYLTSYLFRKWNFAKLKK